MWGVGKGIQSPMAQGRSTKVISMIKCIRARRLSIHNSLSVGCTSSDDLPPLAPPVRGWIEMIVSIRYLFPSPVQSNSRVFIAHLSAFTCMYRPCIRLAARPRLDSNDRFHQVSAFNTKPPLFMDETVCISPVYSGYQHAASRIRAIHTRAFGWMGDKHT